MTRSLAGLTVVVTRPAHQSARLIRLLRERGAASLALPALDIEPVTLDAATRGVLAPDNHDWVVYTSVNAVEQSIAQLGRPARARVAAIGRATSRALEAAGIQVHAVPESGSDSEGLLAHPDLAAGARGHRVLIIKGVGGRDALREGLAARGALVSVAEVYRRSRAAPAPGALAELNRSREAGLVVVSVTSVEVLDSLLEVAPAERCPWLRDSPLLVPGERVAAEARSREWRGEVIVAGSAEDERMVDALEMWSSNAGWHLPA